MISTIVIIIVSQKQQAMIMSKLFDYLIGLNSGETMWEIWINPKNPEEEFRIGNNTLENGGIIDNWRKIGNLESLSFGYQSEENALKIVLGEGIEFKGYFLNLDRVNFECFFDAYLKEKLDPELQQQLENQVANICQTWAEEEASIFIAEMLAEIQE